MDRAMVIASHTGGSWPDGLAHVRAELDRLARQVRRLGENRSHQECDYTLALHHVRALILEAKR